MSRIRKQCNVEGCKNIGAIRGMHLTQGETEPHFCYRVRCARHCGRVTQKLRGTRKKMKKVEGANCAYCNSKTNLTIDHIIPLCKGGLNDKSNFQILCNKCNQKKSIKDNQP